MVGHLIHLAIKLFQIASKENRNEHIKISATENNNFLIINYCNEVTQLQKLNGIEILHSEKKLLQQNEAIKKIYKNDPIKLNAFENINCEIKYGTYNWEIINKNLKVLKMA